MKQTFINAVSMIAMAIVVLCAVFAVSRVEASEKWRDNHGDAQNPFESAHFHKNLRGEDVAKGVALGVFVTCGFKLVVVRVNDKRWTWCGGDARESDRVDRTLPHNASDLAVAP